MKKVDLDSIYVESPCSKKWDEMTRNEAIRFCSSCEKNVYNLSALTRSKAEKLLRNNKGICVRYTKNTEGEMINVPSKLVQITRQATIAAGVIATSLTLSTLIYSQKEQTVPRDKTTQAQNSKAENTQELLKSSGIIKNEKGEVVSDVEITLRDTKTGKVHKTTSNQAGFYKFRNIEPSTYEITLTAKDYVQLVKKDIEILKNTESNFVLEKEIKIEITQNEVVGLPLVKMEVDLSRLVIKKENGFVRRLKQLGKFLLKPFR